VFGILGWCRLVGGLEEEEIGVLGLRGKGSGGEGERKRGREVMLVPTNYCLIFVDA
jgi:hypothetical protein